MTRFVLEPPMERDTLLTQLEACTVLSGAAFTALQVPVVYAWIRGREWLYVGLSAGGIAWPFALTHQSIGKSDRVLPADEFRIWRFASLEEARAIEYELQRVMRPRFNGKVQPDAVQRYAAECNPLAPILRTVISAIPASPPGAQPERTGT